MAFIYDLTDTWNNAGISFNGIKLNATDTASAAGSKLLDLQISGASKFTVGKTGALTATGLIESTVGGFRFPDGTTQTTKATVNSVSGTGTVSGLTLTGTVTNSGSLTLGGTLVLTSGQVTTALGYTPYNATNPAGYTTNVGTVTSVAGTGTVSGLSLTGSVTTSGSLTLGGTLVLTSGQVTDALGFTPYNATNPTGYITASALTPYLTSATAATTYQPLDGDLTAIAALAGTSGLVRKTAANTYSLDTAGYITGITSGDVTTALGFTPYNATNPSGYLSTVSLTSNVTGTLPIANGGTGATTAPLARTALGLGTAAVLNAGVSGGVATLDGSGTVPTSQLPGAVLGGLNYQGTWNASTNVPTLASSVGSKGYYYVVSTAGSTNLNGITDWKIGDWAVYDGSAWQKVDNTDAVSSVNGYTGTVVLTTSDIAQGTNLYFTQAAARGSVSAGTGISYNSTSGVITNSAPDQTVALTGAGTTVVTGTYPNFTITSNDSTVGTVTSVGLTAGTGVSVSGGPITSSGSITVTNTAPDQVVSLTGSGSTVVTGTYPNFTISSTAGSGTVTSVAASGGTTGLTFTGSPITTSGTITLGGTLALANGGTGATTASGARTALELGTAATTNASAYATAAQGTKADTAVQTIASTDGSVTITGTTAIDLSVAVAGSTSNVILPVRNTTGATLTKGTAVYISGATGQLSTVSKAIATSDATSAQTLGLVTANIANNANGNVTLIGTITNIDTSAYTDGAQLYLSPTTAGTLTATKPYAPQHLVYMAVVESAHPSQGKLFVKVQNGYEMDELHNVSAQSPANNDGLFYNTTTSLWEKKSIVTALGYTPYNATNPAGYTTNTGTVTNVNLTAGTGVSVSGGPITSSGAITVTNTAPDQVVSLTGAGTTTVTGTYPNFTVTSNDSATGTVTSVGGTGTVSGLTLTGSVTTSGNLTLGGTLSLTSGNVTTALGYTPVNRAGDTMTGTLIVSVPDTASATKLQGATGYLRSRPYVDATNGAFIDATNTAENAYIPLSLAGSSIRLTTNGGLAALIDASGQIGIGTSSPQAKVEISGASAATLSIGTRLTNTTASGFTSLEFGDGTVTRGQIWSGNGSYASFGGAGSINYSANSGPHVWYTNYSERMRINAGGTVGVGVVPSTWDTNQRAIQIGQGGAIFGSMGSPTIHISTNVYYSDDYRYLTTEASARYLQFQGSHLWYTAPSGTAGSVATYTERMRVDATGNVGIGTASPGGTYGKLTVAGGIRTVDDTGSKLELGRYSAGAPNSYIKLGTNSASLRFTNAADDTDLMVLTNSGSLLVGTGVNNFGSKMEVVTTGSSNLLSLYNATANGGAKIRFLDGSNNAGVGNVGGNLLFYANSADTERMRIDSGGNLLVGTTTAVEKLTIGSGSATSAGINLRTTTTDFVISPSNSAAGGVTIATSWVSGGQGPLIFTTSAGEILRFNNGSIVSPSLADAVGYKGLPQNQQTSAYTLTLADMGDHVYTTAGAFTVTIPANATTAFPIGTAITIINEDAIKTLAPASGVTLVLAGTGGATTGNRTLAIGSVVTIIKVGTNRWFVSGAGVT